MENLTFKCGPIIVLNFHPLDSLFIFGALYSISSVRIQDTGYRIQDTGYRMQTGYRIQDTGYRIQDTGYRIQDAIDVN